MILTADRDERIRVSHFPMASEIIAFCHGHTQFVSKIVLLPQLGEYVVSGSADNTLRLWSIVNGTCIQCYQHSNAATAGQETLVPLSWEPKHRTLAVIVIGKQQGIAFFRITNEPPSIQPLQQWLEMADVQDGCFDSHANFWVIAASGVVSVYRRAAAEGVFEPWLDCTLLAALNRAELIADMKRARPVRMVKRRDEDDNVPEKRGRIALPSYVRKATKDERDQIKQQLQQQQ